MPDATVIMPCFNHARFLADSVGSILRQTHADLELIIVDDCSSDNSWEVINTLAKGDSRIRPIRHEQNGGASKSRNDGLKAARGGFIGFCDADDLWEPEKLAVQIKLLQENPGCDVVYCDASIIDENGAPKGQRFSELFPPGKNPGGSPFRELIGRNFINMQSVLMRKECVARSGYFDERIKWVEDWWYWIKASHDHRFLYCPEPLARYRVHSKSTSVVQKRGYRLNRYKVFKRILRQYTDLSSAAKAGVHYHMGIELMVLGKHRAGRAMFRRALWLAIRDPRGFKTFGKSLVRLFIAPRRLNYAAAPGGEIALAPGS